MPRDAICAGRGNAVDGREQRLDHPGQVIRDRRAGQLGARKPDIHDRGRLPGRLQNDRILRLGGDQVFDLLNLGHDIGQRLARVVVEPDISGDRAGALDRIRGQVVDAFRARHRLLDRRRDKALDQVGRGPGIDRADRDRRVVEPRVLPDLQTEQAFEPDQEDQQADHQRKHRPADEDVGEFHAVNAVIPGPERSLGTRNPYSRGLCSWIPGSPLRGAPE
jgi:hypothetical protein